MRRGTAAAAAVLGTAGVLAGGLLTGGLRAGAAVPSVRRPVPLAVIAAVPDLRWSDVAAMPALRSLAATGADGLLVDKTVGTSTGCLAGLFAVAAGTRTTGPPPGPPATCTDSDPRADVRANRDNPYAADVTALGTVLHRSGTARFATDRAAGVMLAGPGEVRVPPGPRLPRQAGRIDPAVAIRAAQRAARPAVVAGSDPTLLTAPDPGVARDRARTRLNDWLGRVIAATPRRALLVVVGSADSATGETHLHVAVVRGPGFTHHALSSASTGRPPYVQLIDVAPTVLAALRLPIPAGFTGSPMTASSTMAPSIGQGIDADRHAVADVPAAESLRTVVITLASVALALALLGAWWRPARPAAVALARVTVPLPLLSWLAQLIPWWRAGAAWLVAGVVAFGMAAGIVMSLLRRGGLSPWTELLALPGATAGLLVIDQLTGGGLQISAPLGDNPLEAGRFTGVGNAAFAVLLGSTLVVAAGAAGRLWSNGHRRSTGLTIAVAALILAVVVDGAPQIGDDLGGVLAAVPAAAVTLVLLAGWRITRARAVAITAGAVALAAAAAAVDYARPAAEQTHLGHFLGQLLHGGSGTTVHRKLVGILELQGEIPLALAVVAALLPGRWWDPARAWLRRTPGLPAAVAGLLVLMVLGSLLNDSGVAVLGFVIAAAAPAIVGATCPSA